MKGIKKLLFTLLLVIPSIVLAAGSVTVNKSSITIEKGKSATFTVTANNSAGKVTFKSNNTGIATINKSSEWVEKGSTTVTVKGANVGSTTITVDVNAATFDEVPIKKTYTIKVNVTKPKSSNNYLASLTVDGKSVPGFSAGKTSYNMGTTKANSISIGASVADSSAKLSGTGSKSLRYGKNTFNVVVTAENGSKKTYHVSITKQDERNTDNTLKSLSVSAGNIDFHRNTTSYTLKVGHDVSSVSITASANDSKASVSGTGTKSLKDYNNTFSVVVTAENQTKRTYTIKIIRADESGNYGKLSSDNELKSLSVEGYDLAFDKNKTNYDLIVEEDVDSITVNTKASSEQALINVSGNEGLKPGNNEVKVSVTAENGDVNTYTINVFKKGEIKEEAKEESKEKKNNLGFNIWTIISAILLVINLILLLVIKKLVGKLDKQNEKSKKGKKNEK